MDHLLDHFILKPIFYLKIWGLDISINHAIISMWVSSLIMLSLVFIASRKVALSPASKLSNFIESIIEFFQKNVVEEFMGHKGMKWLPFLFSLFLFIWGANLIGLVPGFYTATSSIFMTATLAFVIVFPTVHIYGIKKHGLVGYLKSFIPEGVPVFILPFLIPIEMISILAKPFSLSVRLFANMFAGHLVLLTFLLMIIEFKSFIIAPMPLFGAVFVFLLEMIFTTIQAYIFSLLSAIYIADAMHGGH